MSDDTIKWYDDKEWPLRFAKTLLMHTALAITVYWWLMPMILFIIAVNAVPVWIFTHVMRGVQMIARPTHKPVPDSSPPIDASKLFD